MTTHELGMRLGVRTAGLGSRIAHAWRVASERANAAWNAYRSYRESTSIDRWFDGQRERHERYLSRAHDPYELERLERDWSRRVADPWRMR